MRRPVILINGGPAFDKSFECDSWGINKTYVQVQNIKRFHIRYGKLVSA